MAEITGFENRHTRKGIGGSNPPASVRFFGRLAHLAERLVDVEEVISAILIPPI